MGKHLIAFPQPAGNTVSEMATTASPSVDEPSGIVDGIWLIATHWLAPVAREFVTAEVSVLIIAGGKEFRREFRFTGGDIFNVFNQLLVVLGLSATGMNAPLSGAFTPDPTSIAGLQDTLAGLLALQCPYCRRDPFRAGVLFHRGASRTM